MLGFACLWPALSAHAQITTRTDAVGKKLNEWHATGTAAGLGAVTYENRDGQHSPLNVAEYPQLRVFLPDAASGPPIGPSSILRLLPMVGNSSMAAAATSGGSLPRLYQMDPNGMKFLMMQYLANNLMIYPEHQDHDLGANGIGGYGDLFPSNNCCMIISQGSSGSDQPFLQAVVSAIAAFPPETQAQLIRNRILMPTVQAIFRFSNKGVVKPEDYYSGSAHPVVFDSAQLDEAKMVQLAHEMTPEKVPPLVQMEVVEETAIVPGKHSFESPKTLSHKLADTPVAISRILRGSVDEYGMILHLGKTADMLNRPVQMRFQLLQGDPQRVRIDHAGTGPYTRLRVRWTPPLMTSTGIRSHRVDIGIFATNGVSVSAPAIISFYMLPNEQRFYNEQGQLAEIDYHAPNPDLGLPTQGADMRWLRLMLDVSVAGDGLRSRLMEKLLTRAERQATQAQWIPLNDRLQVITALEAKPDKKDSAGKLRAGLEKDLQKALSAPLVGDQSLSLKATFMRAFDQLAAFTDLYPSFQKELTRLSATSLKKTAADDIQREVRRLIDLGILIEQASGHVSTVTAPDKLSSAERAYLRGLNLVIISQTLFPETLDRSSAPAWVDPRLTTPKPWRDVFRYDPSTGQRLGWIRHQAGRTYAFDSEGRVKPDGPKKPAVVIYERNAAGLLEWR